MDQAVVIDNETSIRGSMLSCYRQKAILKVVASVEIYNDDSDMHGWPRRYDLFAPKIMRCDRCFMIHEGFFVSMGFRQRASSMVLAAVGSFLDLDTLVL
jgi:hypothetical protein